MPKIAKTKEDFAKEYRINLKASVENPFECEQAYLAGFDNSTELTQNLCKDYLKRIKELEEELIKQSYEKTHQIVLVETNKESNIIKGNIITEVDVEYLCNYCGLLGETFINHRMGCEGKDKNDFRLLINPDNINISPIKITWNSLEVAGLLRIFENKYHNERFKLNLSNSARVQFIGEFIEQNL